MQAIAAIALALLAMAWPSWAAAPCEGGGCGNLVIAGDGCSIANKGAQPIAAEIIPSPKARHQVSNDGRDTLKFPFIGPGQTVKIYPVVGCLGPGDIERSTAWTVDASSRWTRDPTCLGDACDEIILESVNGCIWLRSRSGRVIDTSLELAAQRVEVTLKAADLKKSAAALRKISAECAGAAKMKKQDDDLRAQGKDPWFPDKLSARLEKCAPTKDQKKPAARVKTAHGWIYDQVAAQPVPVFSALVETSRECVEKPEDIIRLNAQYVRELDKFVLGLQLGTTALGGTILAALLAASPLRVLLSMGFWLIAATVFEPELRGLWPENLRPISVVLSTLAAIAIGGALAKVTRELLKTLLKDIGDGAPRVLVPEAWSEAAASPALTPIDQVRRWFVTIAASTGAVVGSIWGLRSFWEALFETVKEPRNVLLMVLLALISMFLIGPLQAYIFEKGSGHTGSDPSKKLSDLFADGIDRRAAGRFAMVFALYVQVYLLTSCVAASVKHGDPRVMYTVFGAAITPAIVSYYWSAALQLRVRSTGEAVVWPCICAGAVMLFGVALASTAQFFDLSSQNANALGPLLALLFGAILLALVFGCIACGTYAFAGSWVIDRFPDTNGTLLTVYILAALLVAASVQAALSLSLVWLAGFELENIRYGTFIGAIVGWGVGLWCSGFPRLLTAGRLGSREV